MHKEHTFDDAQRLLERGYTEADLQAISIFSNDEIRKALVSQRETMRRREQDRAVHNQARYAWRMGRI